MAQSNITDYLHDLEIKIKGLQQKVESLQTKISETVKEYNFKRNFIQKDVEKELADYQPNGLGVTIPKTNVDELTVSSEQIEEALKFMYKLES